MKKFICAILLGSATFIGAAEQDQTQKIIDAVLKIENYFTHADKILASTGSTLTVEELKSQFLEAYNKEEFQSQLREAFFKRFSKEQTDEIYRFISSDLYKKYTREFDNFSMEVGPQIVQIIMSSMQGSIKPAIESSDSKMISADESNFQSIIDQNDSVIIDVYASWCGPCKALAPILDDLANEYSGKYVFAKINADTNRDLISKLNARSLPTLVFYKNGKEVNRHVGFTTKEKIVDLLNQHFENQG